MKLTAPAADLVTAIAAAAQSTGTAHAAYTGVLLNVTGSTFTARGSDGDTTVAAAVTVTGASKGEALVPPKPLLKYLRGLDADVEVTMESPSTTSLLVTAGSADPYSFIALAVPFPATALTKQPQREVDLSQLTDALAMVKDSAGALAGSGKEKVVQVVSNDNGVFLHATDNYRLARSVLPAAAGFGAFDGLVPLRVLELAGTHRPTHVQVDPKGRQIVFHAPGIVIASRLSQDPFPTVESVLAQGAPYTVTLDRSSVAAALRRLSAFAGDGRESLRVMVAGTTVTFTLVNPVAGTGVEEVDLADAAPGEVEMAVNFDYMVDAFATHAACETVNLSWSAPLNPLFVTATDPVPSTLVIMPMRVGS